MPKKATPSKGYDAGSVDDFVMGLQAAQAKTRKTVIEGARNAAVIGALTYMAEKNLRRAKSGGR